MAWILCTGTTLVGGLSLMRRREKLDPRAWWAGWLVPIAASSGVVLLWPGWLIVRKGMALLLLPAGLVWFGLMVAPLLTEKRRLRRLLVAVLILYTAAGSPWIGSTLLGSLENAYEPVRPDEIAGVYDAVFVLGGGSGATPRGDPQLAPSGDRIRLAAALYRAGKARWLVTSGSGFDGGDLTAETRSLWLQLGVPGDAILEVPDALNTAQEIGRFAELLAERSWDRVGLITSARHMRRAQALCRLHELKMDPLPADFRSTDLPPSFLKLIPQADGFAYVEMAGWEYLGTLSVQLLGS